MYKETPSSLASSEAFIVVSVQSKDGSWLVMATFDRDGDGKPCSPSAPVVCWTTEMWGRYGNLYT